MTRTYSYPAEEIRKEYWRSGMGITLSLLPLLLLGPSSVIVIILVCFLCLFSIYGIRAVAKNRTKIVLGETAIEVSGLGEKLIFWEDLVDLDLAYFSTRRDGEKGWMQLKLKGGGQTVKIESTISDFWELVEFSTLKAQKNGVVLSASTARNLQALGIAGPETANQQDSNWEKSN